MNLSKSIRLQIDDAEIQPGCRTAMMPLSRLEIWEEHVKRLEKARGTLTLMTVACVALLLGLLWTGSRSVEPRLVPLPLSCPAEPALGIVVQPTELAT